MSSIEKGGGRHAKGALRERGGGTHEGGLRGAGRHARGWIAGEGRKRARALFLRQCRTVGAAQCPLQHELQAPPSPQAKPSLQSTPYPQATCPQHSVHYGMLCRPQALKQEHATHPAAPSPRQEAQRRQPEAYAAPGQHALGCRLNLLPPLNPQATNQSQGHYPIPRPLPYLQATTQRAGRSSKGWAAAHSTCCGARHDVAMAQSRCLP
eukprot:357415-Chlamydomonas_euryale.AAC.2